MGLITETLRAVAGVFKTPQRVGATIPIGQDGKAQLPNFQYETLAREGYNRNEIVFACIEEWCTDIAEPRICAYRAGTKGDERVVRHPLLDLLYRPNPWLSGAALLAGVELHKRLAGNAFIEKVRSAAGRVVELWLLRPDRVRVIPDREKYIRGYEYRFGADTFTIDPRDVIHVKTRNPLDDFYGMPPLMAAAGRTDLDNFMRDVVKSFLTNSGIPSGVLTVSGALDKQDKELLKMRFRQEFGGRNAGNIIVAENGSTAAWAPMAMPLGTRGLVIPELDEIDEARIGMVFRVPASLVGGRLGSHTSSYANKVSDREFFTEQQLVPEWRELGDALTLGLASEMDGIEYFGFDQSTVRALSEDQDALHTRLRNDLAAGGISLQEFRAAIGYAPEPEAGAVFMIPANIVPTPVKLLTVQPTVTDITPPKRLAAPQTKAVMPARLHLIRDRAARGMQPDIKDFFAEQSREIAKNLRRLEKRAVPYRRKDTADAIFPDGQDELLRVRLNGHYMSIDRTTWQYISDELDLTTPYDEAGPVARRILERAGERITAINEVTRSAIRDVLAVAEDRGYSLYQTVNGVVDDAFPGLRAVVDETYQGRAETVARTEAAYATQDAAVGRYGEAGVSEVDVIDGDQDEPCAEANGARWTLAEAAANPIAHPNCTRVFVPVV